MANNINKNILVETGSSPRAFLPSENINIFPCSRRGRQQTDSSIKYYDPEARLNTERTNRLHTAVNGFKDSFVYDNFNKDRIKNEDDTYTELSSGTLTFVLAGYHIEVKHFDPNAVAAKLNGATDLYAYLCLVPNVSIDAADYFTEILYRQSTKNTQNQFLDVPDISTEGIEDYFFVGVSFVNAKPDNTDENDYYLPLFSYTGSEWELVQTSLLPKIEHGETEDSIKIGGDFTVKHGEQISFAVTESKTVLGTTDISKLSAGATNVDSLTVNGTTYLKGTAQIDGETTLYNKLLVKSGNTARAEIDSSKVSFNLPVTVNDTLQVKRTTGTGPAVRVEGSLEVHEGISTETLNANTIQSVETLKTDNVKGLVVTSTAISPECTLKIEGKTDISGDADIDGHLTVSSNIDTGILKATSEVTTPALHVDTITSASAAEAVPVTVEDNLNVLGQTRTSTLKTNTITSDSTEIVVDKALKVDTIDSDAANGLTIKRAAILEKTLNVEGATTVKDTITAEKLIITKLDSNTDENYVEIKTPKLRVNKITSDNSSIIVDDKAIIMSRDLSVLMKKSADPKDRAAVATIDKAIIGDLTVQQDDTDLTKSTGKITAKEVKADSIIQNGSQVPAITLEQISNKGITPEIWQLQIAHVTLKPKN